MVTTVVLSRTAQYIKTTTQTWRVGSVSKMLVHEPDDLEPI